MAPNESLYMTSYMSMIQTKSLSLTVFEIFKKNCKVTFDLKGQIGQLMFLHLDIDITFLFDLYYKLSAEV